MKILFFCGALAAGRDGVGDYTRRLANECAARGHVCTVIALHDPEVARVTDHTEHGVRLIRLPAVEAWPDRLACAVRHLQRIAPDRVSWQLVVYGLHPRGFLPAALLRHARDLRGPHCHVMMHELWLGLEAGAGWRARMIGWLQKRGVLRLLEELDPNCVQTSNETYRRALTIEGVDAGMLGLFGNITIEPKAGEQGKPFAPWLPPVTEIHNAAPLIAMTFGTLHPQWQPAATVDWLITTARRLVRQPVLVVVGRAGAHAAAIVNAFQEQGVTVAETGELDAPPLSQLLRGADLGIAPHPWALIGKSGAATAMLEHGLPVLVPRDDWRLRGDDSPPTDTHDPLLERLSGLDAARTDRWLAARRKPESFLPRIADAFLAALECESLQPPVPRR